MTTPFTISLDIKALERSKRVTELLGSKIFMEKMHQICRRQTDGISTINSDRMRAQGARINKSNMVKKSNCLQPINDIQCEEVSDEKQLRYNLAALFRLLDLHGWTHGVGSQISARLNHDQGLFLVNPYGLLYNEITASSLVKVNTQGEVVDQGATNYGIHLAEFQLHSTIYAARPDITCVIHIKTPHVTAVSSLKCGLLPVSHESIVIGDVPTDKILGASPIQKVTLLTNRGAFYCGETIEEAFFNCSNIVLACETQVQLMPMGIDNIYLISEEDKKSIFETSRKSPSAPVNNGNNPSPLDNSWGIGQTEFKALMRMVDTSGFRTGYRFRKPLLKSGHEEYNEKLLLTTPNVNQKLEVVKTGPPHPANIGKWIFYKPSTHRYTTRQLDKSSHFVQKDKNPKEFEQLQQYLKDNSISGENFEGPQSSISKEISCEKDKTLQDPTSSHSSPIKSIVLQSLLSDSSQTEKARQNDERLLQIEKKKLPKPNAPEVVLCDDIVTTKEVTESEKLSADVNAIARNTFFSESKCTLIVQQTEKFPSVDELEAPELENLVKDTIEDLEMDSSNEVENHESVISSKSVNNEEVDNDMLNFSLGTIGTSFQNDVNDLHPDRSSSPIIKNHQHDDSIHEVISHQNVDVTPAQENSPYELCETENSLNYIPDSIPNQEECIVNEIVKTNDQNAVKNNEIHSNDIIDLFDNSIDIEALSEHEFRIDCDGNEKFSTETFVVDSDILETSDSVAVQLQVSKDLSFHKKITSSANEIVGGIGECDTIFESQLTDEEITDIQFINFDTKADETHCPINNFKSLLQDKILVEHITKEGINSITQDVPENCTMPEVTIKNSEQIVSETAEKVSDKKNSMEELEKITPSYCADDASQNIPNDSKVFQHCASQTEIIAKTLNPCVVELSIYEKEFSVTANSNYGFEQEKFSERFTMLINGFEETVDPALEKQDEKELESFATNDKNEIVDSNEVNNFSENSIQSKISNESESLSDSAENEKISAEDSVIGPENLDTHEDVKKSDTDEEVKSAEESMKNDTHEFLRDEIQPKKNKRKGKKKSKQRVDNIENVAKNINTLQPAADLENPKSKKSKGRKKNKK